VVEHWLHHPRSKGLSPAHAAGTGRETKDKIKHKKCHRNEAKWSSTKKTYFEVISFSLQKACRKTVSLTNKAELIQWNSVFSHFHVL